MFHKVRGVLGAVEVGFIVGTLSVLVTAMVYAFSKGGF
jgi:hypothetical protein